MAKLSKIKGKNIMLFIGSQGSEKAIALCTNSTLSLTAETEDLQTKDDAAAANPEVQFISWEASSENYYSQGTDTIQQTSKTLMGIMLNKTLVHVVFGAADNASDGDLPAGGWAASSSAEQQAAGYYEGDAYITSLEISAENGEYATCSMTLTGKGALSITSLGNNE